MKREFKHPDTVRMLLLSAFHALYIERCFLIVFFGSAIVTDFSAPNILNLIYICAAFLLIPMLLGFVAVKRVKGWLISLPIQLLAGLVVLFATKFLYLAPFLPRIILFVIPYLLLSLAGQAAGGGIKMLYLKKQSDPRITGTIRAALLTLFQALYIPFADLYINFRLVTFSEQNYLPLIFTYTVCCGIPLLAGLIAVDRAKWWLISLPVQLAVSIGLLYAANEYAHDSVHIFFYALFFLVMQAVGAGVRLLHQRQSAPPKEGIPAPAEN